MKRRYAIVGTGARAISFIQALIETYHEKNELVALCDISQVRMDWHNKRIQDLFDAEPVPTYMAVEFDQMIKEMQPDTVIVTTPDSTHDGYIIRTLRHGLDVISEKPITTDVTKLSAIGEAVKQTGCRLQVAFNYRYAPAYTMVRKLLTEGQIGTPLNVDFSWMLDVHHGADYFRRWHREKANSGGLLVHKATHHFDLVNWWLDSYAEEVFAYGRLAFYGKENAESRGEHYAYPRYTGVPEAQEDPFTLDLLKNEGMRGLYFNAESETGYMRDRNVFGESIDIEDTMCVVVRYRQGSLMSYNLIAYSPWEGMRVAITGTRGRIELEVIEAVEQEKDTERINLAASKGTFEGTWLRVFPQFAPSYMIEVPKAEGGHGGADPLLFEHLFAANPPFDPYGRSASFNDGAASILVGIAANQAITSGTPVCIDDLFPLK